MVNRINGKCLLRRVALLLCFSPQLIFAHVVGTVKDKDGLPLAGAYICKLNPEKIVAVTNEKGEFQSDEINPMDRLMVSYVGYANDTVLVKSSDKPLEITLSNDNQMSEVQVVGKSYGLRKDRVSVTNREVISEGELLRAACCNLGASFTTNPSVDVSYSDASTGAKQIKLLGLSGRYVQMLTENIPNYRGSAAPYSLGYIPGTWMQSIQVSKGSSSVKNGYEAITGQINVEFKKPQDQEQVNANLYANHMGKLDLNADGNIHLTDQLSTALLAHYEKSTMVHDDNNDGFVDAPKVDQLNLQNRWMWKGKNFRSQFSVKGLFENRESGQIADDFHAVGDVPYKIGIETQRYEAFAKNAFILNREKEMNVALILSGSLHNQDGDYGGFDSGEFNRLFPGRFLSSDELARRGKFYDVEQQNFYSSLLFETKIDKRHSLSTGLSFNYDRFDQQYRLGDESDLASVEAVDDESVPGAYAQYTYNLDDKWVAMAGLRWDYSSVLGSFFTPRAHLKYAPNEVASFRASVGKGYRYTHPLAENSHLLASSRKIDIREDEIQEEAWNYGLSSSFSIPVVRKNLSLGLEYYYTRFSEQLVVDMDETPHSVVFHSLDGDSYSHTFQVDASYPFFKGFLLTGAYRLTDVKATYNGKLREQPFTNKYKALLTATYKTNLELWQFDVTFQYNGGGRLPLNYMEEDGTPSWKSHYSSYPMLNAQVTRLFRHWSIYVGGENLTNYKQSNPIVDAQNPWGSKFDSSMIYGPIEGIMGYIGVRYNWKKL
ncbi:MAG: TonB-dependent receptor [Paludibacteraceae bacterium]|nr:TonB-dependent receptor [Paludibacteraceae bacterium]